MALIKLRSLHAFIESQRLVMPEQFDSWMEDGNIKPQRKKLNPDQYLVCLHEYDAVLVFDRFTGNPALLMVIICAWLTDSDGNRDDRKLPPPSIDVDMVDDKSAQVEIRVRFSEDIILTRSETGAVSMMGERWDVGELTLFEVDTVGVGNDQSADTDLPYTREP